jgi:hypothetical protein
MFRDENKKPINSSFGQSRFDAFGKEGETKSVPASVQPTLRQKAEVAKRKTRSSSFETDTLGQKVDAVQEKVHARATDIAELTHATYEDLAIGAKRALEGAKQSLRQAAKISAEVIQQKAGEAAKALETDEEKAQRKSIVDIVSKSVSKSVENVKEAVGMGTSVTGDPTTHIGTHERVVRSRRDDSTSVAAGRNLGSSGLSSIHVPVDHNGHEPHTIVDSPIIRKPI